jgi:hypothetical protein
MSETTTADVAKQIEAATSAAASLYAREVLNPESLLHRRDKSEHFRIAMDSLQSARAYVISAFAPLQTE